MQAMVFNKTSTNHPLILHLKLYLLDTLIMQMQTPQSVQK